MLAACGGGGGSAGSSGGASASSVSVQVSSAATSQGASSARSSAVAVSSSVAGSIASSSSAATSSKASSAATSSSVASSVASSKAASSIASSSTASSASGGLGLSNGFSAFYSDPNSQVRNWVAANPADSRTATINSAIAQQAFGKWFGEWSGDIATAVSGYAGAAQSAGKIPLLIAYNIPSRDCGSYSAGGSSGGDAYKTWISAFAGGIGSKPAIVILEPDALMQLDCLPSDADRTARLALLNYAVDQFAAKAPNAWVYIDAGHSNWKSAADTATRLINAGVARVRGFALNVSNYRADTELQTHGAAVIAQLQLQGSAAKPYVIDSSRNGNGPNGSEWCDPAGRKVGATSKVLSLGSGMEMALWLKAPGEADGCAAGAGQFSPDLAYRLATGG
ncbi:glycoside hydrolase family 6 protein [Uliginosibacterium sp. IMCC34675]|uniref:Glucanase n=2 Tax=Uliginosibacterium aquaticum TaxID=2731212 RepID=A0ABX2ISN2_9RHOO|nr:glycoside hydrolase family 6 protein [Uliginosibacterium aquaticum]